MNLRLLKSFLVICQTGSITRAADLLHISQPALSRQVQDLEEEVGTALFARGKRQLALTAAGQRYQASARQMLALAEGAAREAREAASAGEIAGRIRIGVVESTAQHRRVQFDVFSGNGDAISERLDHGDLDYGIVLSPVEVAKYRVERFPATERWGVAVRKGSPCWGRKSVSIDELKERPLILPFRNLVEDEVMGWFSGSPGALRIVARFNLCSNAFCLMRRMDCDAILCEGAFTIRQSPEMQFVPIKPERLVVHWLIRRKQDRLSRAALAFWDRLDRVCREGGRAQT